MSREKLFAKIWKISESMRGSVDSWEFKNVIFSGLYLKYMSAKNNTPMLLDDLKNIINERFGLTRLTDTQLQNVINELEQLEELTTEIDVLGDAYEYLMNMYANNGGKSGGEFYTPQEVSKLLTLLALKDKKEIDSAYDCCSGSGSLLLQVAKNCKVNKIYGQEINPTSHNICQLNMLMHGVDNFDIQLGDTLTDPKHLGNKFDIIVANPPYSIKWEGESNPNIKNDPRFSNVGAFAPKSKADWSFVLHNLHHLADNGTMSIVMFPGVLYREKSETKIRKYLIDNNYIDTIIQLPVNLFINTTIPTSIIVLSKNKTDNKVLFIDASNEFVKVTKNNQLSPDNINKIVEVFKSRQNIKHFSQFVDYEQIVKANYNLSVSTYVEQEDKKEKIDIDKLNKEISEIVLREEILRKEIDELIVGIEEYNESK